jgi:hypothetical protein
MIYDIPSFDDNGPPLDDAERNLAEARARREASMTVIEVSRRSNPQFPPSIYSAFKIIHGNAEEDVRRERHYLRCYEGFHFGDLSCAWMWPQAEMTVTRPSLTQVWCLWRDVVAARKALADLEVIVPQHADKKFFEDDFGSDVPVVYVGTARQRVEARAAVDRAAGLYDLYARVFEGRQPRTHEQTLDINRIVRKPKKALPPKRIAKTPTKYVRGPNGINIPRS